MIPFGYNKHSPKDIVFKEELPKNGLGGIFKKDCKKGLKTSKSPILIFTSRGIHNEK